MTAPERTRVYRPYGVRMAGLAICGALVALCVITWFAFPPEIRDQFTVFQRSTLLVLFGGFIGVYYAMARSRVEARPDGLVVVNGFRRRDFEWAEVLRVSMPAGAPWVRFDISDGSTVSGLGIQGSDGRRAQDAVAELKQIIAA